MRRFTSQIFKLRLLLCTTLALFLVACGKGSDASKSLSVGLTLPPGYSAENFWLGVTQKKLVVEAQKGDKQEVPWGNASDISLHKGDRLHFEGCGPTGQLLVFGDADVGDENTISIPLQRAL